MTATKLRPRAYIAGPMTGIPDYNFPAFYAAEEALRKAGWNSVNPARMDDIAGDGGPGIEPQPHEHYMHRDLPHLWRCTHIAVLPGWVTSRGARIEVGTALAIGLAVVDAQTFEELPRGSVVALLEATRQPGFIV